MNLFGTAAVARAALPSRDRPGPANQGALPSRERPAATGTPAAPGTDGPLRTGRTPAVLDADPARYIDTVRGVGYRMAEQ